MLIAAQRGLTGRFERRYSESLFRSVLRRPYLFFKSQTVGSLIEVISLRGTIRDVILSSAIPAAINFLSVMVLVVYLAWISMPLTLLTCGVSLLFSILAGLAVQRERDASQNYVQRQIAFTSAIQQDILRQFIEQIKMKLYYNEKKKKDLGVKPFLFRGKKGDMKKNWIITCMLNIKHPHVSFFPI